MLVEGRIVFSKSVTTGKSTILQWKAAHPRISVQHKLVSMGLKIITTRNYVVREWGAGSGKSWRKGDICSTYIQNSKGTKIKYAV